MVVRKSTTDEARRIWNGVSEAAKSCPSWIRRQVQEQAEEHVRTIMDTQRHLDNSHTEPGGILDG